jgi:uncharacterized membrane protein YhhN
MTPSETSVSVIMAALLLISLVSAVIYGFVFSTRSPSRVRALVSVLPVGALAAMAAIIGASAIWSGGVTGRVLAPWMFFTAGLAFVALGDGLLSGEPKRWLVRGMAAFSIGHLCFITLFLAPSLEAAPGAPPVGVIVAMALVIIGSGLLMVWLWQGLGSLFWGVAFYVLISTIMVCAALSRWSDNPQWAVGGLLFLLSDFLLAGQLFMGVELLGSRQRTIWAIWFLHYAAQLAFFFDNPANPTMGF